MSPTTLLSHPQHTIQNPPPSPSPSPPPRTSQNRTRTLYFAYGSNLSKKQMRSRCPTSEFYGLAVLKGWKWIIGTRGYANVVRRGVLLGDVEGEEKEEGEGSMEVEKGEGEGEGEGENEDEDKGNLVYGLLYHLEAEDEEELDIAEGVPFAYKKRWEVVEVLSSPHPSSSSSSPSNDNARRKKKQDEEENPAAGEKTKSSAKVKVRALVYVDEKRTAEGGIQEEYIRRMNRGIVDAVAEGMPRSYVDAVLRRWVVDEEGVRKGGYLDDGEEEEEVEDPFHPRNVIERRVDGEYKG